MKCPTCRSAVLRYHRLEQDLAGYSCVKCQGVFLSLGPYVDWAVKQQSVEEPPGTLTPTAHDSKHALLCPKCSRLMVKYRVAADSEHGLDYCFTCEEVWLDGGEWALLKSKGLHTKITTIPTDAWQRLIREEFGNAARLEKFRQSIGEEAFPEVERFREWLADQPERSEILRYLGTVE